MLPARKEPSACIDFFQASASRSARCIDCFTLSKLLLKRAAIFSAAVPASASGPVILPVSAKRSNRSLATASDMRTMGTWKTSRNLPFSVAWGPC